MSTTARTARLATAVALGAGLVLGAAAPAIAATASTAPAAASASQSAAIPGLTRDTSWAPAKLAWTPEHGTPVGDLFYTDSAVNADDFGFRVDVKANYRPADITVKARPLGAGASADVEVPVLWQPFMGDGRGLVPDSAVRQLLGDVRYELRLVVADAELDRVDAGTRADFLANPIPEADHSGAAHVLPFVDYARPGSYTFEQWPTQREMSALVAASAATAQDAVVIGSIQGFQGLTAEVSTAPQHGTAEVKADGSIVYTATDLTGTDEFVLSVSDGKATKTIAVHVAAASASPERPVPGSVDSPYGPQNVHGGTPSVEASAPAQQTPASQAPAAEQPAAPAPAASSEALHAVPGTVQTGDAAAWWLAVPAAAAAAAAGALAFARRRSARA